MCFVYLFVCKAGNLNVGVFAERKMANVVHVFIKCERVISYFTILRRM